MLRGGESAGDSSPQIYEGLADPLDIEGERWIVEEVRIEIQPSGLKSPHFPGLSPGSRLLKYLRKPPIQVVEPEVRRDEYYERQQDSSSH